jgi:hypothetical protein
MSKMEKEKKVGRLVYGVLRHFQQYFSYIVAVSFIGWGLIPNFFSMSQFRQDLDFNQSLSLKKACGCLYCPRLLFEVGKNSVSWCYSMLYYRALLIDVVRFVVRVVVVCYKVDHYYCWRFFIWAVVVLYCRQLLNNFWHAQ